MKFIKVLCVGMIFCILHGIMTAAAMVPQKETEIERKIREAKQESLVCPDVPAGENHGRRLYTILKEDVAAEMSLDEFNNQPFNIQIGWFCSALRDLHWKVVEELSARDNLRLQHAWEQMIASNKKIAGEIMMRNEEIQRAYERRDPRAEFIRNYLNNNEDDTVKNDANLGNQMQEFEKVLGTVYSELIKPIGNLVLKSSLLEVKGGEEPEVPTASVTEPLAPSEDPRIVGGSLPGIVSWIPGASAYESWAVGDDVVLARILVAYPSASMVLDDFRKLSDDEKLDYYTKAFKSLKEKYAAVLMQDRPDIEPLEQQLKNEFDKIKNFVKEVDTTQSKLQDLIDRYELFKAEIPQLLESGFETLKKENEPVVLAQIRKEVGGSIYATLSAQFPSKAFFDNDDVEKAYRDKLSEAPYYGQLVNISREKFEEKKKIVDDEFAQLDGAIEKLTAVIRNIEGLSAEAHKRYVGLPTELGTKEGNTGGGAGAQSSSSSF